jgi:hypothetical protein
MVGNLAAQSRRGWPAGFRRQKAQRLDAFQRKRLKKRKINNYNFIFISIKILNNVGTLKYGIMYDQASVIDTQIKTSLL